MAKTITIHSALYCCAALLFLGCEGSSSKEPPGSQSDGTEAGGNTGVHGSGGAGGLGGSGTGSVVGSGAETGSDGGGPSGSGGEDGGEAAGGTGVGNSTGSLHDRPPIIDTLATPLVATVGQATEIRLSATDPEGEVVRWSLVTEVDNATVTDAGDGTASLRFEPAIDQVGLFSLYVTVSDGDLESGLRVSFFSSEAPTSGGRLVDVRTASSNVVVVVVETPLQETGSQSDGSDVAPSQDLDEWSVGEVTPSAVGRWSYVWHEESEANDYSMVLRHHMYLELPSEVPFGGKTSVKTPYGEHEVDFDLSETVCESIHLNQVGYFSDSEIRYANMGVFLGDLGPRELDVTPAFEVVDEKNGSVVHSGTASYWGDDTAGSSGTHVYRLDLAPVPTGGPYFIRIPGVGRSHSFGVGAQWSSMLAYVSARGLYHQRCGTALVPEHTPFSREECAHVNVQVTDAEPPEMISEESDETRDVRGGYHDAADYDRRLAHTLIPAWFLNMYEAFPENMIDGQLNIPESGNGVPDWLDEALWGLRVWLELQDPDGGVRAGTETTGHPTYGQVNAASDRHQYKTFRVDGHVTASAAGLFAHASRLLEPFDESRSVELLVAAQAAWNWVEQNDPPSAHPAQRMYASLQLYLATGDEEMHEVFRSHAEYLSGGAPWPQEYYQWFNLNTIWDGMVFAPYFFAYTITEREADSDIQDQLVGWLESAARSTEQELEASSYPIGTSNVLAWGTATNQGRYAEPALLMYRLTGEQQYLNRASELADYSLGLNPAGKVYTTRLGSNPPNNPLHADSYFTHARGIGVVPGITVYGPLEEGSAADYEARVHSKVYPSFSSLPLERRYTEGWSFVGQQEFTTWETMALNACMYGVLASIAER